MNFKKNRVLFSRFPFTVHGGGGCRRELQLVDVLAELDLQCISGHERRCPLPNRLKRRLTIGKDYAWWAADFRDTLYRFREWAGFWADEIDKDLELIILDDPIFFAPLVKRIKELEIPLIANCHNLESLSFAQVKHDRQLDVLDQELRLYRLADLIITISREETVIFNNLNLPAWYLPYYPAESIAQRLSTIRERRRATHHKADLLLLGTVNNAVTKQGVLEFITHWKQTLHARIPQNLLVAGYGTEQLRECADHETIQWLGPLPNNRHDDLLTTVRALVSYQKYGSGALTRNTEMLLAGVPVLANTHAARSYYGMPGVIEFRNIEEFEQAFRKVEHWQGNVPLPQKPDSKPLLDIIRQVIHAEKSPHSGNPVKGTRALSKTFRAFFHPALPASQGHQDVSRVAKRLPPARPQHTEFTHHTSKELNLTSEGFSAFTYARLSHFSYFRQHYYDIELYGKPLETAQTNLKQYADLLVFAFIKQNIPSGARILEIGQGYPRVLRQLQQNYECWMIAPCEHASIPPEASRLLQERLITGVFDAGNSAVPAGAFDCVFSVAVLGQLPNNPDLFENALCAINQALSPGGYSLHCVNIILKPDHISTNGVLSYFGTHAEPFHEFISFETLRNDPDLFMLSERFYKAHWQPKTKQPYRRFGKPTVCNMLWQKACGDM